MENKIKNAKVWGLPESILASGYPMSIGDTPSIITGIEPTEKEVKRATHLGSAVGSSGHDCYLKGIIVQFDWKISQVIFPQVERYHFIDIVSSQSKMHRLHLAKKENFHELVDPEILNRFLVMLMEYNLTEGDRSELFQRLVYSCPMGYELTARFTTNYLQLKTIYQQRKHHKMQEWKDFCRWVESLPNFMELTQRKKDENHE